MAKKTINVKGTEITIISEKDNDYISLTDMAKKFGDDILIYSWLRNRNTIEFLGVWEQIYNPDFKGNEFVTFKSQVGLNSFNMTPQKWINATNAIGLISKSGRYGGGTFAHKDIAFEFGSWLSPEFKLYLIKEFQRLKDEESSRQQLNWNLHRTLAKINYRIHTDSVKENLIPPDVSKFKEMIIYAGEADLLNMALFGMTAKQWRDKNPGKEGNIRDYSTLEQLLVLTNLESLNAELIRDGIDSHTRLLKLNQIAIKQMTSLLKNTTIKKLK